MSMQIRFEVDGVEAINRMLQGYVGRVSDLTPVWEKIVGDLQQTTERTFAVEGAVDGLSKWPDLKAGYEAWKKKRYSGGILVRTGALQKAATAPQAQMEPLSLTMTLESDYALYHQSKGPRKKLPRRPIWRLDENEKQKRRWIKFFREFLFKET